MFVCPLQIDEQIETMFASVKRVTDVAKPLMGGGAGPIPGAGGGAQAASKNVQALEKARLMASRIHMARNLGAEAKDVTQQAAVSLFRDGVAAPQVSSKTIAEQMAEKINAKLGYTPPTEEEKAAEEPQGETFKRYEEELEINDFPQTARWKVTSKEALAQICEYSEAGITVRGTYVPPQKEPKEGERRLYLAIEATSELAIQKAKKEVTRLIKEELVRLVGPLIPSVFPLRPLLVLTALYGIFAAKFIPAHQQRSLQGPQVMMILCPHCLSSMFRYLSYCVIY